MGWSYRKSTKIGPFRLNASSAGLGWSVGGGGVRYSSGPRGNFIHLGAYGFRYSQRVDAPSPDSSRPVVQPRPQVRPTITPGRIVEVLDPSLIEQTDADRVLDEIRSAQGKGGKFTACVLLSLIFFLLMMILATNGEAGRPASIVALLCAGLAFLAMPWASWSDSNARRIELRYVLDPLGVKVVEGLGMLFDHLIATQAVWSVKSEHEHGDRRRNAGTTTSIDRNRASVRFATPPDFVTNVRVGCLDLGGGRGSLYFFPDRILIFRAGEVRSIPYTSLRFDHHTIRFVEDAAVPSDSEVVGRTWQFVNKNGSPDRRFNNNRQLPIALYGCVDIESGQGLRISLQLSSVPTAIASLKVFDVIQAMMRQVEAAGSSGAMLPIPASVDLPLPPPPLAGVGATLWAGAMALARFLAHGWVQLVPEGLQPIAWGVAIATPAASALAWVMSGRPRSALPAVASIAVMGMVAVMSLVLDYRRKTAGQRQADRQARLDERRAAFRAILVSELKYTPIKRFNFDGLVDRSDVEPADAELVADELYEVFVTGVVADGVITREERDRLKVLAGVLKVGRERAERIEASAKQDRFEKAVAEAAEDGVFTDEEVQDLGLLRKSLGLGSEVAIPRAG